MKSIKIEPQKKFNKTISLPSDKSILQRAIIIGGLFDGIKIKNPALCGDCLSTLECVKALGATAELNSGVLKIKANITQNASLNAQNSATAMRLLAGGAAGQGIALTLDGDLSLKNRSMLALIDALKKMGAQIEAKNGFCPLKIKKSTLVGIDFVPKAPSAQIKSAVLLAGLGARGTTTVLENHPTRDHTERLLSFLGADIGINGHKITINHSIPQNKTVKIAGDISSAAFMLAAAIISPDGYVKIKNVGLNPLRMGMINVLTGAGADILATKEGEQSGEPFGSITARSSKIKGFTIDQALVPSLIDELPILAAIACFADGVSVFKGLSILKNKESDRMEGIFALLKSFGAKVFLDGDTLTVQGGVPYKSPAVLSFDHRIIMTAAVLGISAAGCVIQHPQFAAISYPDFFRELSG